MIEPIQPLAPLQSLTPGQSTTPESEPPRLGTAEHLRLPGRLARLCCMPRPLVGPPAKQGQLRPRDPSPKATDAPLIPTPLSKRYLATIAFAYINFCMFLAFFVALVFFQSAVSEELGIGEGAKSD